jgi:hypothetical protein
MEHFLQMLPALFVMGLAGVLHCAGMCGGFSVLITSSRPPGRWASLLLYFTGKSLAYVLLGAIAGALGEAVLRAAPLRTGGRILVFAAAAVLIFVAFETFGVWRLPQAATRLLGSVGRIFGQLAHAGGPSGKLVAGMANGFLPCPMTYAFVAAGASTGSPVWGAATMLVLGLTSALPLTAISLAGGRLALLAGRRLHWVSGGIMLVMAAMLLRKGIFGGMMHGAAQHMHGH